MTSVCVTVCVCVCVWGYLQINTTCYDLCMQINMDTRVHVMTRVCVCGGGGGYLQINTTCCDRWVLCVLEGGGGVPANKHGS